MSGWSTRSTVWKGLEVSCTGVAYARAYGARPTAPTSPRTSGIAAPRSPSLRSQSFGRSNSAHTIFPSAVGTAPHSELTAPRMFSPRPPSCCIGSDWGRTALVSCTSSLNGLEFHAANRPPSSVCLTTLVTSSLAASFTSSANESAPMRGPSARRARPARSRRDRTRTRHRADRQRCRVVPWIATTPRRSIPTRPARTRTANAAHHRGFRSGPVVLDQPAHLENTLDGPAHSLDQ
jgi:hypothetical protein